jgi:cytosine/adenosine deaminase-related metal-dependent hydrolase
MRLTGARVALSANSAARLDLEIRGGRIYFDGKRSAELDLSGHMVLPGLINSHDHLEFNLFPRLGRGPYPNATAWAEDIYHPERSPIKEHLAVPKAMRLLWGGLKNLLTGVTTVAHHNPYDAEIFETSFPVRVVKRFGWAHSLRFSPDLAERFRASGRWPFLMHAAEGTDASAAAEIPELERIGILRRRTVIVHGVAVDGEALKMLLRRRASLVWCPSSNLFTLARTASPEVLRSGMRIALGTDSALTCQDNLAGEIRVARKAGKLSAEEIYPMVTSQAARILCLKRGEGEIREGGVADLLVVPDSGQSPAEVLQRFRPAMVILGGKIQLVSKRLASHIEPMVTRGLQKIQLAGGGSWLVNSNVSLLYTATEAILGPGFQLAGRRVRV